MAISQAGLQFVVSMQNQASQVAAQIASSFTGLGASVISLNQGLELVSRAFNGLGESVGEALNRFSDFDKSLNLIERVTGASEESIHALGDSLNELATKLNIVKTSNLAKLADDAATVGIRGSQNLLKFAETMSKVQEVVGELGPGMTRTIVSVLNALGPGIDGVEQFANVLTRIRQSTASSVESILTFSGRLAEAGAQFNLTSAQILGLAAAASEIKGLQAQRFGTAFNRSLNELRDAALNGTEGMRELGAVSGVTREEFLKLIKDNPTQAFLILAQSVDGILKSGKSATGLLESLHLQSSETSQVISDVGKNFEAFSQKINLANKEAREQIILQQEWEVTQKRFQSATDALGRAWEQVQIAFGKAIAPVATVFFETLTKVLDGAYKAFTALPNGVQTVLAGFAALAISAAAIATAISAVEVILGALGISAAAAGGTMAGAALVAAGPWVALAAAIAAGAAVIYSNWDKISGYIRTHTLADAIIDAGSGIGSALRIVGGWLKDGLDYVFKVDENGVSRAAKDAAQLAQALVPTPQAFADQASAFQAGVGKLKQEFIKADQFVQEQRAKQADRAFGTDAFIGPGFVGSANITPQKRIDKAFEDFNQQVGPDQRIQTDPTKVEFDADTKRKIESFDKTAAAIAKVKDAELALKKVEEDPNNPLFARIGTTAQEFLARARASEAQSITLANPVNQFLQGGGDEFQKLQAITGEERNRQEIEAKITELQRQRHVFADGEEQAIRSTTEALQNQRAAQGLGIAIIGASNQLLTAKAVTQEDQNQAAIQVRINDLIQQYGKTAVEANSTALNRLLQIEDATRRISQIKSVLEQAEPIAAAYQKQVDALKTIDQLSKIVHLTEEQRAALTNQIKLNMEAQVDPIAALQRAQSLELAQLSTSVQWREADSKTLAQINQLKMQGIDLDKEGNEAARDALQQYNRLLQDIQRTQNSGFEGFIKQVGDTKQAILDTEKDFAEGLSTALTGVLTGQQNAWQNFISSLSSRLIKRGIDLILADTIKGTGLENLFGFGSKGLIEQAKGVSGSLGKLMTTATMNVQAGVVNIGSATSAAAAALAPGGSAATSIIPKTPDQLANETISAVGANNGAASAITGNTPVNIDAGSGAVNVDTTASASPVLNFPSLSSSALPTLAAGGALTAGLGSSAINGTGAFPNAAETMAGLARLRLGGGLPTGAIGDFATRNAGLDQFSLYSGIAGAPIGAGSGFGAAPSLTAGLTGLPHGWGAAELAQLTKVSQMVGADPKALLALFKEESGFNSASINKYGYAGLSQIGTRGPGGGFAGSDVSKLGFNSTQDFLKAGPAAQIGAYGDWLKMYNIPEKLAKSGLDPAKFAQLPVAQQYAILQGTQFAPNRAFTSGLFGKIGQGQGFGSRFTGTAQAPNLGSTSLNDMMKAYPELSKGFGDLPAANPMATIPQDTLQQLQQQSITNPYTSAFGNITNPGQQLGALQLPGLDQIQSQLASAGSSITSYASSVATSGSSALSATGGINQLISSLGNMGGGGGGFGGFGSLFGGFGGGGFGGFGGGFDDFAVAHSGWLVGSGSAPAYRNVSGSIFSGARRYHGGLMSDEFPAILQRGERVLTAGDNAKMTRTIDMLAANAGTSATNQGFLPGNAGARPVQINYNISTPDHTGFERNQDQINQRSSTAMQRAVQRNG